MSSTRVFHIFAIVVVTSLSSLPQLCVFVSIFVSISIYLYLSIYLSQTTLTFFHAYSFCWFVFLLLSAL